MSLKVNITVDTDETGKLTDIHGSNVVSVDASNCGDEAQAIAEAAQLMEHMDIQWLKLRYGSGAVELRKGDDLKNKAQELFFASCCFNLYEVENLGQPEFKFGNPNRPCNIETAAHSALRISKHFDRKVSFKFNDVALPPVHQKDDITLADVRAVMETYTRASDKHYKR
jgi:hypothetical protein